MTCRIENGVTYIHSYNAENRLSKVELVTGDCDSYTVDQTWTMTYDGDGVRVKQVHDDGTTVTTSYTFGGGLYEVVDDGTTTTTTKYYSIAGMRVGMHDGAAFSYLLTDHLGSVNMVISETGTVLSEQREFIRSMNSPALWRRARRCGFDPPNLTTLRHFAPFA
jgi:hypothetical protein